eukprot:TRINITY_DN4015_c0_g4_i1.p1 TRINITY_DN4015_c0_g4~~TRINITY_DN4015_c0_g4_i1.p1  ORF type:complete len:1113 (+),score=266.42 TRINITY_DN4015_c0_g4_i1:69-3407(+)
MAAPSRNETVAEEPAWNWDNDNDDVASRDSIEGADRRDGAKKRRTVKLPITVVIALAMVTSSSASIAGGLVMYFESLKSLEATVEETSVTELACVAEKITDLVYGLIDEEETAANMLYAEGTLPVGSTRDDWASYVRRTAWSAMTAKREVEGLGVVLYPKADSLNDGAYMCMWAEPMQDGTRALAMGFPPKANVTFNATDSSYEMAVPTYYIHPENGSVAYDKTAWHYTWNAGTYLSFLGSYNSSEDQYLKLEDGYGFGPEPTRHHRVIGQRHRPAGVWTSFDGVIFAYSVWDRIYAPPPPPHPWSNHAAVLLFGMYDYASLSVPLEELKKKQPDTTLVMYDDESRYVYASTTGRPFLDVACYKQKMEEEGGHAIEAQCFFQVDTMPEEVIGVYNAFKDWERKTGAAPGNARSHFMKTSAGGTEMFARQQYLYQSNYLLWLRPTSTVQDEINAALYLLVLFSVLVFLFDLFLAILEYIFVARPMMDLSNAIAAIGSMDTKRADRHLAAHSDRRFMLKEVYRLVSGMTDTIVKLNEYRSYLPDASLEAAAESTVPAPTGTIALAFSDIVGSTSLWEAVPEEMAEGLDVHNRVLREMLKKHNGYEVKTIGDAFMVAFQSPQDAYNYGMDVQAELVRQPWPEELCAFPNTAVELDANGQCMFSGIRLRIGVHFGEVEVEVNPLTGRSDYRGGTVNKAARIEPQALHGMTAFSEELMKEVTTTLPVHTLGTKMLKGIGEVKLFYSNAKAIAGRDVRFSQEIAGVQSPTKKGPPLSPAVMLRVGGGSPSPSRQGSCMGKSVRSCRSSVNGKQGGAAHLERNLKREKGAVALLNLTHLNDLLLENSKEPRIMLRAINQCVQLALDVAGMTEGKLEYTNDSTILMSWGLSSRVSQATKQCLRFVGNVMRRRVPLTLGAVCGPFLHGNVGTANRRYHTIVGTGCMYLHRLPRMCARYGHDALVMVAGGLPPALGDTCTPVEVLRTVGEVEYGPCAVLESPLPSKCAGLELSWDGMDDEPEDLVGPVQKFRNALQTAVRTEAALDVTASGLAGGDIPASLHTLYHTLVERGADIAAADPAEWAPSVRTDLKASFQHQVSREVSREVSPAAVHLGIPGLDDP